jgi:hypothetical protein
MSDSNTLEKKKRLNVRRILGHLCKKDNLNMSEGKKPQIWVHNSHESDLTNFEMLSQNRIIGLETTLDGVNIVVLMKIFEQLFDHNLYHIDDWINEEDICETLSDGLLYKKYAKYCNEDGDEGNVGDNEKYENVPQSYTIEMLLQLF